MNPVHLALVLSLLPLPLLAQQSQPAAPAAPKRTAVPANPLTGQKLLSELRKGGYVIYFRHASTDFSRNDEKSRSDDDCDNQRPLNDKGRDEAREIGTAFRELKIPVGAVLVAPRCRAMETATLAFGRGQTEQDLRDGLVAPENPERYAPLRKLLSTSPKPGSNLVISGHANPFLAIAGGPYLVEGEAAVLKPLGGDFEIVARVRHDAWRPLARAP